MRFLKFINEKFYPAGKEFKFPDQIVKRIEIVPETGEEWFGITIDFEWKHKNFYKQIKGMDEEGIVVRIAQEVQKSKQWGAFYKRKQVVSVDRSSIDNTQVSRQIPKFGSNRFDNWNLTNKGGWISASTRDGGW